MNAKEFIELDSDFEDVTFRQGDTIKIHIEVLYKMMEEYHQAKLKLLGIGVVVGQSEQYCECDKPTLGGNVWTCGCGKPFKKKDK